MFHHESVFRGEGFEKKVKDFHITICGCGTNGSNLLENLCRHGYKKLTVIDMDRVEIHNIGTQIFEVGDVGQFKVIAARNKMFRISKVSITPVSKRIEKNNIDKLIKNTSLVVDCFDNHDSRKLLADYCKERGLPLLHLGVVGGYGEIVWNENYTVPKDVDEGDNCDYPLARNLALLVVAVASEEIVNFSINDNHKKMNWEITLNDFKVSPYTGL